MATERKVKWKEGKPFVNPDAPRGMNADSSLTWLEGQVAAFQGHRQTLMADPADGESLHAARLARKRVAMALRWMEQISDALVVKKQLHRSREAYSAMGELRDLQLMEARLAAHAAATGKAYPALAAHLERQRTAAQEEMRAELSLLNEEQWEKVLTAARKALKKTEVMDFAAAASEHAQSLHGAVARIPARLDEEKALHRIRKRVRDCGLFLRMAQEAGSPALLEAAQADQVRSLARLLGNWHDLLVFQDTLSKWVKRHTTRKEDDPDTALYAELRQLAKADVKQALATLAEQFPKPEAKQKKEADKPKKETGKPKKESAKQEGEKAKRAKVSKPAPKKAKPAASKQTAKPAAKPAAKKAPAKAAPKAPARKTPVKQA